MMNKKVHIKVYFTGRCPRCNGYNEVLTHDYGLKPYKDVEKEMDKVNHTIRDITCKSCSTPFPPKTLLYKETLSNTPLTKVAINYDRTLDVETSRLLKEAHANRFDYFKKHEPDFWDGFVANALQNWRDSVNELQQHELLAGLNALNISTNARTVGQLRREVLNKINNTEQKAKFWRVANHDYVYNQLVDVGVMGWHVESDVKQFGKLRTRYVVLNFPMEEVQERLRTEMIGKVVRTDRGDSAFLFRRLSQMTDELDRMSKKMRDRFHQIQELRAEIEDKNKKINELQKLLKEEKENKNIFHRNPNDVRKIHELKNLIKELTSLQQDEGEGK